MKRIFTFILLSSLLTVLSYASFDEWGVWQIVTDDTIVSGEIVSFGVIDMTDRKTEFNILAYGVTPADSLMLSLELFGMMEFLQKDTLRMVSIYSSGTVKVIDSTITFADTLSGEELFPFLYGRITNEHADSSVVLSVYVYSRPEEKLFIRLR